VLVLVRVVVIGMRDNVETLGFEKEQLAIEVKDQRAERMWLLTRALIFCGFRDS
jgi:hypothetical protein